MRRSARAGGIAGCILVAVGCVAGCSSGQDAGLYGEDGTGAATATGDNDPASGGGAAIGNDTGNHPGADLQDEDGDADAGAGGSTCDHVTAPVLYLSADDSNSMAGAGVARGLIQQGQLVYKGLRTYEFLNYYSFDYPAAPPGQVAVSAQMHSNDDGTFNLQIGVRAPDQTMAERRPLNITLSVDSSSSMKWGPPGNTAMDRVREACLGLSEVLRAGDVLSISTWSETQTAKLDSWVVQGPMDPVVVGQCSSFQAYGATDLGAGLEAAYQLAQKNYDASKINRVVLLSDGGANVSAETQQLIAQAAQDDNSEGIYLMGAGVGDPWNYNDQIMNLVTDSGKGAYVFLDTADEAHQMFGPRLLSNVEIAARDVQVQVTLPPTMAIEAFHGEQMSAVPTQVKPQHLAMNDAMIFHQVLRSCDPASLNPQAALSVHVAFEDPITRQVKTADYAVTVQDLLAGDNALLRKGDAVVAFAEALKKVRTSTPSQALSALSKASAEVDAVMTALGQDADLVEIAGLITAYKGRFDGTGGGPIVPTPTQPENPILPDCGQCSASGNGLAAMRCAADLCDDAVFQGQSYESITQASTQGTYAAMPRFGSASNDLAPQLGGSYAVIASGPVQGQHSTAMGGTPATDPFAADSTTPIYDAMEWTIHLKAPADANGFSVRYVYFSEEYDDYIGTTYNDKLYMILRAGSTNSGDRTVINFTDCRAPDVYYDFVCGQGMQHCNPGQRYCYVAINAAESECCWHNGCPNGYATTDISGTGFSCALTPSLDGSSTGSSTGWLETQWPIEPNEEFDLTLHIHDSGDGIFDSAAIIDRIVFLQNPRPGTSQL